MPDIAKAPSRGEGGRGPKAGRLRPSKPHPISMGTKLPPLGGRLPPARGLRFILEAPGENCAETDTAKAPSQGGEATCTWDVHV